MYKIYTGVVRRKYDGSNKAMGSARCKFVFYGTYFRPAKCHVSLFLCKRETATNFFVVNEVFLGLRCAMSICNLIKLLFFYRDSNRLQSSTPIPPLQSIPSGTPVDLRRVRIVAAPRIVAPPRVVAPAPPPRPHRPILGQNYAPYATNYSPYSSYGSYGTSYGGFPGIGTYGSTYGGYGSYGSYGMNRFGYNQTGNDPETRYINLPYTGVLNNRCNFTDYILLSSRTQNRSMTH